MAKLRLDKYLADMQVGTRAQVKEYIKKGRIKVDNNIIMSPECKVDTENDTIYFDSTRVGYCETEYIVMNKPVGVLSATRDKNASTVLDLLIDNRRKDLFPVGRLDKDTEGLLLITNDGQLAHELLSPKKHVDKVYYARISGKVEISAVELFAQGIQVDDQFRALPAQLKILVSDDISEIKLTIREGKFHQVKRMFEAIGTEVIYLKRLSMGSLVLDDNLAPGEYRQLTLQELDMLKTGQV